MSAGLDHSNTANTSTAGTPNRTDIGGELRHVCAEGYRFNDRVVEKVTQILPNFPCDQGLFVKVYTCGENDSWAGFVPGEGCVPFCHPPSVDLSFGVLDVPSIADADFKPGDTVSHNCTDGAVFPDGSQKRTYTCQEPNTWANLEGTCEKVI